MACGVCANARCLDSGWDTRWGWRTGRCWGNTSKKTVAGRVEVTSSRSDGTHDPGLGVSQKCPCLGGV